MSNRRRTIRSPRALSNVVPSFAHGPQTTHGYCACIFAAAGPRRSAIINRSKPAACTGHRHDPAIAKSWKCPLHLAGYRVITASNGSEGFAPYALKCPRSSSQTGQCRLWMASNSVVSSGGEEDWHGYQRFSRVRISSPLAQRQCGMNF
jgi:hypothetical protein